MAVAPEERDLDRIAVVGMAGRFPRAASLADFWRNLRDGVESIAPLSAEELRAAGVPEAFLAAPTYVRAQARLEGLDRFDARFFSFSAREAEVTNPQHRLLLECSWEALEDAGIDPARFAGTVGVFASASSNTYILDLFTRHDVLQSLGGLRVQLANEKEFLPAWIAYKLDLKGPAVNVQTACSSSLVAVHLACQSLLNGECDAALAGGVSVRNLEPAGYFFQDGAILSPDGHCRAFDASAGGTVNGDGAGVVVLKRLADAVQNGDNVRAVILGSAINNDGAAKVGFTAPSEEGQTRVIAEALAIAGIAAEDLGYVEAHGTGTRLGDPIEIAALSAALRASTAKRGFCALGSVKTNLGHLDAGAGIAGLIKTVLSLEHRELVPSLHFTAPNPEIDFAGSPLYVNAALKPWESPGRPRRAGVSSFGIGGTNAHAVLEEAPEIPSGPSRAAQLLVWSARSEAALEAATDRLGQALADGGEALPLADAAYTLLTGRRAFEHRRARVCRSAGEATRALASRDDRLLSGHWPESGARPVVFLFPGQGAQRAGATRELYREEKVFRGEVDRAAEILAPHLGGADLRRLLYPPADEAEAAAKQLDETAWAQPAVFVIGYALARLFRSWGVKPAVLLGHSLGEYAAACLAGVFRLEDALALVALRGRLMQELPPGGMLALPLSEAEVAPLLTDELALAAVNGPRRTVVAGALPAVERLAAELEARGIEGRRLRAQRAFHSPMMEPVLAPLAERFRALPLTEPQIPYVSNLTGLPIRPGEATDADFWLRHLRHTVRFAEGAGHLLAERPYAFLELGAGRTLLSQVGQHPALSAEHRLVSALPRPAEEVPEIEGALGAVGALWTAGAEIAGAGLFRGERRRRISLPTYPFERQRYFLGRAAGLAAAPWTELAARQELSQDRATGEDAVAQQEPSASNGPSALHPVHEALVGLLKDMVQEITGMPPDRLDAEAAFLDIGVDSLLLIQASQKLRDRLGVRLTVVQLLEELPTLGSVADYLARELPPERLAELVAARQVPVTSPEPHPSPSDSSSPEGRTGEGPGGEGPPQVPVTSPSGVAVPPAGLVPVLSQAPILSPPPVSVLSPQAVPAGGAALTQLFAQQVQVLTQQLQILQGAVPAALAAPVPLAVVPPERPEEPAAAAPPAPAAAGSYAPIGPFQPFEGKALEPLSPRQQAYLDRFIARYTARTAKSKELTAAHRQALADGRNTVGFRRIWKELVYPIHSAGSRGSRLRDVDGNEYVDINMGFGLHVFGHSPGFLTEALERQLRQGVEVGPQSPEAGRAAELLCSLTGMERAMFCNSGTEAILGALRLARTVTGRPKVVLFSNSFHGWADATMVRTPPAGHLGALAGAPGLSAKALEDMIVLEYGDARAIDQIRALDSQVAAVLIEPVRSRAPEVQLREFLHALRQVTRETGAALVFDEMITGFRLHLGGAQAFFGVDADLVAYGKLLAGGLPVGAIAGRSRFMDALDGGLWGYGDASYPAAEKTFFTGTFFKHPLVMAAVAAVLGRLRDEGPALQERLGARTARLAADLNADFAAQSVPMEIVHCGSLFRFRQGRTLQYPELFFFHLVDHGVYYTQESGNCFLTTAHGDEDLARIRQAVQRTIEDLDEGGFLPAAPGPRVRVDRQATGAVARVLAGAGGAAGATEGTAAVTVPAASAVPRRQGADFSLYYFGPYEAAFDPAKYDLLLTGARFADEHGFAGIWLPERHFHAFGGLSPNPSVVAAALARETKRLEIRAGSVVVPLHHPVRLAEEWAVVDNLSGGRVGVSFASGWSANDFVFAPHAYDYRHDLMDEGIAKVRALWRGEALRLADGAGQAIDVRLYPLPRQREIPIWLTSSSPTTFAKAGRMGAGILTNLQGQSLADLAGKIEIYYRALAEAGHDPATGRVTVLLHTYLESDQAAARAKAEAPLKAYLRTSMDLSRKSHGRQVDFELSQEELEALVGTAYERYIAQHALIGTPDSAAAVVDKLVALGVTEIGCLIDFGIDTADVVAALPHLDRLRQRFADRRLLSATAAAEGAAAHGPALEAEVPVPDNERVIWIATRMGPAANRSYNEPLALRFVGSIDVPAMQAAVQTVADRHQALRASFNPDGTILKIAARVPVVFPLIDLSGLAEPWRGRELDWCLKYMAGLVFDLENGPLLRVALVKREAQEHLLSLTAHHIVIDGPSAGVMVYELGLLYDAYRRRQRPILGPAGSLTDWVWKVVARRDTDPDQQAAEAYWRQVFTRPVNLLELPMDRPRPKSIPFWGDRRRFHIDPPLMAAIKRLGTSHRATPFATVLAAFGALLHELTQQEDLIVGIPSRDPSVTGPMVGYYINLLPVRMDRRPGETYASLLAQVRQGLFEIQEHQSYPLNRLLEKIGLAGGLDGFLIGTTYNMERVDAPPPLPGLETEHVWVYHDAARIDLHLNVIEDTKTGGGLLELAYKTTFFDAVSVDRWLAALVSVLRQVAEDPATSLFDLPLLAPADRQQLLREWNDTADGTVPDLFLHQLFERQAALRPQAAAVALGPAELSYGDLDRLAAGLAAHLAARGVGPEVRVGLCLDRSFELIVCALAIVKAGGVYVPLEPTQPRERLLFLLKDARVPLLITRANVVRKLGAGLTELGIQALDVDAGLPAGSSPGSRTPALDADNLAYVIYTSGSTGRPNGVTVSHRSAVNLVHQMKAPFRMGPETRLAMIASLGFDVSVFEIFTAFAYGACLCLIREEELANPVLLADRLARMRVTTAFATPSRLSILPDAPLAGLTTLAVGGEAASADLVARWSRGRTLLDCYGPTETTIYATIEPFRDATPEKAPPIGRPIGNTTAYVVNPLIQLVPLGVTGELALGGVGVARGYLERPAKTAEKFVPDPFAEAPGARLYLTGDRARQLPDGRIEYLGRADGQIKLRGFRIELGEIESLIAAEPGVKEAAVAVRGEGSGQMLSAYLVWDEEHAERDLPDLRQRVEAQLPEYMVPAAWIELKEIPKTVNGKIDRLLLRAKQKQAEGRAHVDPETPLERYLVGLWQEVLHVDRVSLHDNFLELGGNSISAAMLAYRLQEILGETIHALVVFDAPTIADLAPFLAERYPDTVIQIWGEESLPESVKLAVLELAASLELGEGRG